jgi:hypothetical protein
MVYYNIGKHLEIVTQTDRLDDMAFIIRCYKTLWWEYHTYFEGFHNAVWQFQSLSKSPAELRIILSCSHI